jgi:pimeloyl-ACP methyl ester carboxylesterase
MACRSDYLTLGNGRQVHYLRAGAGSPVLLLHPSPLCAAFLKPLIDFLSRDFDVIAMDTPGYGSSDPLADPGEDLQPYVVVVDEFIDRLGVGPLPLYGNATGAQLAIECAKFREGRVSGLVLENAACFSDEDRERLLGRYFPDLSPRADGSHLELVWQIARQQYQFFPWYDTSESARVSNLEPPLALVQATVQSYLQAGPDYARAYRAAFANERPEQLAAVTRPVEVLLWEGSILLQYSRRLQRAEMPTNICFTEVGGGIEQRYTAVSDALSRALEST